MEQRSHNPEAILVLTAGPADKTSLLEWRPFDYGDSLGEILLAYNHWCRQHLEEETAGLFPDCRYDMFPTLELVAHQVGSPLPDGGIFERVRMVMVDLEAIGDQEEKLIPIQAKMACQNRVFHLIQVGDSVETKSKADFFGRETRLAITGPEVYLWQWELEELLSTYCQVHAWAWQGVALNPYDAPCSISTYNEPYVHPRHGHFIKPQSEDGLSIGRLYTNFHKTLPDLVATVRDAAIVRRLSESETLNLGRAAAAQEFLLFTTVDELSRDTGCSVSVDPIRKVLYTLPVDSPMDLGSLKDTRLLLLRVTKGEEQPPPAQQETLTRLGFSPSIMAVVNYDCPELWRQVETIPGLLTAEAFSAKLPAWNGEPNPCQIAFGETSFGVPIEESISKKVDNYYLRSETY